MKRRLSDKIVEACQQALSQGRTELAERLKQVNQTLLDDEKHSGYQPRLDAKGLLDTEDDD